MIAGGDALHRPANEKQEHHRRGLLLGADEDGADEDGADGVNRHQRFDRERLA